MSVDRPPREDRARARGRRSVVVVAVLLLASAITPAFAQDDVEARLAQEKGKLRTAMQAEQGVLRQLFAIDMMHWQYASSLRKTNDELRQVEAEIERDRADAARLEAEMPVRGARLASRLSGLYRLGRGGFWKVLLTSDSYAAFVRRYRALRRIVQADAEALTVHRAKLLALRGRQTALANRQARLAALREQARREALDAEVERRKKLFLLEEIRRDKTLAARFTRDLAQRDAEVGRAIAALPAPPAADARLDFAGRRGNLPPPVAGPIVGRFGTRLREEFGTQTRSNGIDIAAPAGAPVQAVAEGVVTYIGELLGYGRVLIVDHGQRCHTLYAHLSGFARGKGDAVRAGEILGFVGSGGLYPEPTLHFEIRIKGAAVDPLEWLAAGP
jgi:septal ring factor EnvC (AmiA/AmiB activator)